MSPTAHWPLPSLDDLEVLAPLLTNHFAPGDWIALTGPMGAGKTTLTQALCRAWGTTTAASSPTFSLLQAYDTPQGLHVLHGDLYRLSENEILAFLPEVEDAMRVPQTLLLLEWANLDPDWDARWTHHLSLCVTDNNLHELTWTSRKSVTFDY